MTDTTRFGADRTPPRPSSLPLPLPELLAPAGSEDSLRAALAAGADAVYFGGAAFSNRMRANNFAGDALGDAIRLTHAAGARAHITINTRVRDRETDDALRLAASVLDVPEEARADAIIIADLGLAAEIRKRFPDAVLHASTQTSMGSADDCRFLAEHGFSRLVLPRELSRDEAAALCRLNLIEIEVFLHGALCVSCSGQCLMSYFCGGRSGNRGECAQPCRLPYRVTPEGGPAGESGSLPLSLADLCLAGQIPSLIETGVRSLKIEGRLKAAPYVYGVTSVYRRLLDEGRPATAQELELLRGLFTRGFTDGYYTGRYARMDGKKASEDARVFASGETMTKALTARIRETEKRREAENARPVTALFELKRGAPARLLLRLNDTAAEAFGDIPSEAEGKPLSREAAAKSLVKCGGSGFSLDAGDIVFDMEDGLWMPTSRLNDLRRRALETLADRAAERGPQKPDYKNVSRETFSDGTPSDGTPEGPAEKPPVRPEPGTWILEAAEGCLTREIPDGKALGLLLWSFARLDVPAWEYARIRKTLGGLGLAAYPLGADLPVFPLGDAERKALFGALRENGCETILAHTPGQVRAAREAGFEAAVSFRGNITNRAAAEVYRSLGCGEIGLSPELSAGAVRAFGKIGGTCIAYGRVPVMTLARCVLKGSNPACTGSGGRRTAREKPVCRGTLTDRRQGVFPVIGGADCVNTVYNAVPIWMGGRLGELSGACLRFLWTTETLSDMLDVVRRYRAGEDGEGRRI